MSEPSRFQANPWNAQRSSVIPLIADFLGAGGAEAGGSVRSLMLQRIARFLPQAQKPQVLIVEDLQNGDAATADFMLRLCEQMAGSQTLLLINHRGDWSAPILAPFYDRSIELKPWQRRHPLLAGITLLPRLLKSGAVR